jgi:hypothetical protein
VRVTAVRSDDDVFLFQGLPHAHGYGFLPNRGVHGANDFSLPEKFIHLLFETADGH